MRRYIASDLKDMNRRTVYNLLASKQELSRAEISRRTGISSPTVIKIINHFIELGFVTMEGEGQSKIGRKPQILRFNANAAFSIGVDLDNSHLRVGIVDLLGGIVALERFDVSPNFIEMIKDKFAKCIDSVIRNAGIDRKKLIGVGIGIPGSVDPERKTIGLAPLYGVTGNMDTSALLAKLSERLGLPVMIERDVNAAALGEFVHRNYETERDLIYVSIGNGVGAGIILNGKLHRGGKFMAGEIGYLSFDPRSRLDPAMPGWLEGRIGSKAIENIKTDREAIKAISEKLSLAISCLSISLDVSHVVIGGTVATRLGAPLLADLDKRLSHLCLGSIHCVPPICREPIIVGAAGIVTENKLLQLLEGA